MRKSKLTDETVAEIVRLGRQPGANQKKIAHQFDISVGYCNLIIGAGGRPDLKFQTLASHHQTKGFTEEWKPKRTVPVLPVKIPGSTIEPPDYMTLLTGRPRRRQARAG